MSPFSFKIHLSYYGSCSKHHPQKCSTEEGEPLTEAVVTTGANEEKKDLGGLRPYSSYSLTVSVFNNKGEGPESEARPFNMPEGGERSVKVLGTLYTSAFLAINTPNSPQAYLCHISLVYRNDYGG